MECEGHVCVGTVVKKVGGCVGEFWNSRKWLWWWHCDCDEDGVEGSAMEFGDAAGVTVGLERWEVELGRRFKKQRRCVKEAHERDEMIVQNTRNLGVF